MAQYKKESNFNFKQWTKDEVKRIMELWDTKSREELISEFNCSPSQFMNIINQIRKAGYFLERKRAKKGNYYLINEAMTELGIRPTIKKK